MIFFNKPRIIVATDRNFYVMHGMSTPGQVLAKYPRATTRVMTGEKRFFMLKVNIGPASVWAPMVEAAAARQFAASSMSPESAGPQQN